MLLPSEFLYSLLFRWCINSVSDAYTTYLCGVSGEAERRFRGSVRSFRGSHAEVAGKLIRRFRGVKRMFRGGVTEVSGRPVLIELSGGFGALPHPSPARYGDMMNREVADVETRTLPPQHDALVVTQANALAQGIHADLDLYQVRLVRTVIAVLARQDSVFPKVRLYVPDLCRIFGLTNSNSVHAKVRRAAEGLLKKVVHIDRGNGSWKMFQWFSSAEYTSGTDSEEGVGFVDLQLHEKLDEYLLQLQSRFFSYPLSHVTRMSSKYAIRLFELLLADSYSGRKRLLSYELDDLRHRLEATQYADFKDFRRNVLDIGKRECERTTNLSFEYDKVTRGRKVIGVTFTLNFLSNEQEAYLLGADDEVDVVERVALQNDLLAVGFRGTANEFIETLGVERVRQVLEQCKIDAKRSENKNPIRNMGAYVRTQLRQELQQPTSAPSIDAETSSAKAGSQGALNARQLSKLSQELYQAWEAARGKHETDAWDSLSDEVKEELEELMKRILPQFTIRQLNEHGWRSSGPVVAAARREAMQHAKLLEYPEQLRSLSAFVDAEMLLAELDDADRQSVIQDAAIKYN